MPTRCRAAVALARCHGQQVGCCRTDVGRTAVLAMGVGVLDTVEQEQVVEQRFGLAQIVVLNEKELGQIGQRATGVLLAHAAKMVQELSRHVKQRLDCCAQRRIEHILHRTEVGASGGQRPARCNQPPGLGGHSCVVA